MSEDNTNQQETIENSTQPLLEIGQSLKAAREKAGLSIDELSSATRLNPQVLSALEEYHPDQLPPMTFVLGYIRSYAKHVGLDISLLHIERLESESHVPVVKSTLVGPPESSSRDLSVRVVSYLIIVGALVLFASWWMSQKGQVQVVGEAEQAKSIPMMVTDRDGQQNHALSLPQQNNEVATTEEKPVVNEIDTMASVQEKISVEPEPELEPTPETEPAPEAEPAVDTIIDETSQIELIEKTEGNVSPVTEMVQNSDNTSNNDELPADTLQSIMELTYTADSWTEISDAIGRRLVFDLVKEGKVINVKGVAPFSVFLGFAKGVSIKINEEPYNNRQLTRNGIARFKAGLESGNRILNQ